MTSAYQNEQSETLGRLFQMIQSLDTDARERLLIECSAYLRFRREVDVFLSGSFSDICTRRCYENRRSACCSREGIITFFADMVINVLCSDAPDIDDLLSILAGEAKPGKCIYLGNDGCLWRIKPIVCQMFLCDRAKDQAFLENPSLEKDWKALEAHRKQFTWPDKPTLFDDLERHFINAGYTSPLMYMHNSPGLLRLKRKAGLA